jgi:hypothetical protein
MYACLANIMMTSIVRLSPWGCSISFTIKVWFIIPWQRWVSTFWWWSTRWLTCVQLVLNHHTIQPSLCFSLYLGYWWYATIVHPSVIVNTFWQCLPLSKPYKPLPCCIELHFSIPLLYLHKGTISGLVICNCLSMSSPTFL